MSDDKFGSFPLSYDQPPKHHFPITPNDATDMANIPRSIFIGVAGTIVLHDASGTAATYTCPAGYELFGHFRRVLATGTTASGLVGRY